MKTERLYEDNKIVLEKLDDNYRVTFFNDDNHWGGDMMFNEKDGIIYDDVKEDDIKINECIEYAQNKIKSAFCNVKCGANRPCEKYDYKNHSCEDFYKFKTLLKI
mgnify:CR=1 FL=1